MTPSCMTMENLENNSTTNGAVAQPEAFRLEDTRVVSREAFESAELRNNILKRRKLATIGELAGGIAHEFNNILGGAMSYIDFALNYDNAPGTMRKALEVTQTALERMAFITENMRYYAGESPLEMSRLDVVGVVGNVLDSVQREFAARQLTIERRLAPVRPIRGDAAHLKRVFTNIVVNALEALAPGGKLSVRTVAAPGEAVSVEFTDTGSGIAPENTARVFDPFFTTKGVHNGGDKHALGLGLAVSLSIVERHGGKIELDSALGGGSTFRVILPVEDALNGHIAKVLFVGSLTERQDFFSRCFRPGECETCVVTYSEDVPGIVRRFKPDVVLVDWDAPGSVGMELLRQVTQAWPQLVVAAAGTLASKEVVDKALDAGACEYIIKPLSPGRLRSLLGKFGARCFDRRDERRPDDLR